MLHSLHDHPIDSRVTIKTGDPKRPKGWPWPRNLLKRSHTEPECFGQVLSMARKLVLFVSNTAHGHLGPLLAPAAELLSGHDVLFASMEEARPRILNILPERCFLSLGQTPESILKEWQKAVDQPNMQSTTAIIGRVLGGTAILSMEASLPCLLRHYDQ